MLQLQRLNNHSLRDENRYQNKNKELNIPISTHQDKRISTVSMTSSLCWMGSKSISVLRAVGMVNLSKQIQIVPLSLTHSISLIPPSSSHLTFSSPLQCKVDNKKSTVSRTHNCTQLYAIKYVVDRPIQNQTHASVWSKDHLAQARPRQCWGMISALLYAKNLNDDSQDKQQKKTINSSASSSSSTAIINETNGGAKNRLLICAPSISSLQDNGIVNARGRIMKPKMVRPGKPLDGSPPKIRRSAPRRSMRRCI
jgi:hypothetical protein